MTRVEVARSGNLKWDWPLETEEGSVRVINNSHRFEVGLQCTYFQPDEIEVKVMDQDLVVHCKHESRGNDFGTVSREVHRVYRLPSDVDPRTLKSQLHESGTLQIHALKKV